MAIVSPFLRPLTPGWLAVFSAGVWRVVMLVVPRIGGRKTQLFSAWLAWSRFRVVVLAWDQQAGTLT